MSTEQEIKVAEILRDHVLPVYKKVISTNWSYQKIYDNHIELGICNFVKFNMIKNAHVITEYFEINFGATQYLYPTPLKLEWMLENWQPGITNRIAWMENFIATHLPQENIKP